MGLFSNTAVSQFPWETVQGINDMKTEAAVIFKHSTRCAISRLALSQFERAAREWGTDRDLQWVKVDVLAQRPLSNAIAETFGVQHESPQVLVFVDGKLVYHASHEQIDAGVLQRWFVR